MPEPRSSAEQITAGLQRVDRLLAEDNLSGAQRVCRTLLQQQPTSAAAHEKMGDILYRRELWEDAVEWYQLAMQLAEAPELREKIADARDRSREARIGGPEPEEELVEDTRASRRRLIWLGIAAAAMLVLVVVVLANITGDGAEAPPSAGTEIAADGEPQTSPRRLTAPSSVRGTRSTPSAPAPVEVPRAEENPQQHWSAPRSEPVRAPRRAISRTAQETISEPLTEHDRSVTDAVSSLSWGDDRSMSGQVNAMVDPYTGYAMVSVTVPRSLPRDGLIERVVRQAYRVARATFRADEGIKSITIRMITVAENNEHVVAFRGNTNRAAMGQLGEETPGFTTLWDQVFKTVWWNPQAGGEMPSEGPAEGRSGS